jgi:hypothetical protein
MTYFTSTTSSPMAEAVLMRRATAEDAARIRVLALLDNKRMPSGPFLVAEASGEIVAARSLSTSAVVADPFRLTSDIVAMLSLRAGQIGPVSQLQAQRAQRSARRSLRTALAA